ncbi:MAG: hypothetical protein Q9M91_06270 [Candidatus Dojkabacteria bacterium]|nr:hypothetical protein [Candidatus Dojkabacteria bacterium]MDQ7021402.1 hypothetical protein [Candidatus Dojkabacteria bacterium]
MDYIEDKNFGGMRELRKDLGIDSVTMRAMHDRAIEYHQIYRNADGNLDGMLKGNIFIPL